MEDDEYEEYEEYEEEDRNKHVRTTIYIPRYLYEKAKMMAVFTRSNTSRLICVALQEKLVRLKEQGMK